MELNRSYSPGYFSLQDILATQERVPCHVEKDLKDIGFLDPGSDNVDLAMGTKLELPYWMVEVSQICSNSSRELLLSLSGTEIKHRQELRLRGGPEDPEGGLQGDHER